MDVANHVGGLEVGNFTKHKAIGKNGSFWLPPAASEGSFSNKLNSFRTQSKSPRVGVKSDVIDQNPKSPSATERPSSTSQANHSSRGTTVKENSPQIITKKNLSDAKNQNSVNPKPASGFPVLKSLPMSQVDIKNVITATNPLNQKVLRNHEGSSSPCKELADGQEHHGDSHRKTPLNSSHAIHGTKNAFPLGDMELAFKNHLTLELIGGEVESSSEKSSGGLQKLLDFAAKKLIPRIALFAKNEKKVVRFAMDLHNGDKLGVRLEKSNGSLKICFISADEGTNEMLEVLRKLITNKKDSLNKSENIEVFSFKSYEEMDRFFYKAA